MFVIRVCAPTAYGDDVWLTAFSVQSKEFGTNGSNVRSLDVLRDESINGTMTLEPLDFKLLRVID